ATKQRPPHPLAERVPDPADPHLPELVLPGRAVAALHGVPGRVPGALEQHGGLRVVRALAGAHRRAAGARGAHVERAGKRDRPHPQRLRGPLLRCVHYRLYEAQPRGGVGPGLPHPGVPVARAAGGGSGARAQRRRHWRAARALGGVHRRAHGHRGHQPRLLRHGLRAGAGADRAGRARRRRPLPGGRLPGRGPDRRGPARQRGGRVRGRPPQVAAGRPRPRLPVGARRAHRGDAPHRDLLVRRARPVLLPRGRVRAARRRRPLLPGHPRRPHRVHGAGRDGDLRRGGGARRLRAHRRPHRGPGGPPGGSEVRAQDRRRGPPLRNRHGAPPGSRRRRRAPRSARHRGGPPRRLRPPLPPLLQHGSRERARRRRAAL
ncbi:MAG: Cysteine desulfurase, partial [uncultured Gemmatimonadetes bacterium]